MRVLVQRVSRASCTVDGQVTGAIEAGLCLFVGIGPNDTETIAEKMATKLLKLRIFSDEQGKMNRNVLQINGSVLSISQFTLYADCRKGNRPGFNGAASPEKGKRLYEFFNTVLREQLPVETGIFGADMKIDLVNDGPVTIWLDSETLQME